MMSAYIIYPTIALLLLVCGLPAQIPVTKKQINNSDSTFRFAIVSDRTGGMEPGIFAKAIDELNLMQPEFVISVGDLIDGYTEDPKIWNAQWNEFDSLVNRLDMPFYYVPGNHDVSNALLTAAWRKRHGSDYYSFVYKNTLFISMNTDEIKNGGMSTKQIDFVLKTLKENANVKWTLLFMHRPLWSYGEKAGYETIEKALINRKYTVFSGHHHNYQYQEKNGMDHYVLATTGGGSWRRGAEVGEFDHITWVTMKEEGPKVALIDINGIYDKKLIPPSDYEDIESLRRGNWLTIETVVSETDKFTSLKINLLVKNDMKRPMIISGELPVTAGVQFEPHTVFERLIPGQHQTIPIIATSASGMPIKIEHINNHPITLELKAGFEREKKTMINLATSKRLFMDWNHPLKKPTSSITVDGKVDEWKADNFIVVENPQYLQEDWDWKGADDGQFSFDVAADNARLYIVVKFKDNFTISDTKNLTSLQDKFYVHINPEPKSTDYYQLEFAAGDVANMPLMNTAAQNLKGLQAAITKSVGGQILEVSVPLASIGGLSSNQMKINIGIMDHDRPENTKPSVLWWRPIWSSTESYKGSSLFYK